jgi:polar amino acid transport system substrate-binding protein
MTMTPPEIIGDYQGNRNGVKSLYLFVAFVFLLIFFYFSTGCVKQSDDINTHPDSKADTTFPLPKRDWKDFGVLMGSTHEVYAHKHFTQSNIHAYNTVPDLLMALDAGKVEAAMMGNTSVQEVLKTNQKFVVLEKDLLTVDIAAGFHKESDKLREQFNTFLAEIRENGVYDQMVNRWVNATDPSMPDITIAHPDGVLKAGVVGDIGLPFAAKNGSQWLGFDIELSGRFAAWLGKEIEWVDMPFGSLLPSLISGKIEIITATMMISEERRKQIDFSDVYYVSGVSIIGKKGSAKTGKHGGMAVLDDIADKRVGIFTGTVHDAFLEQHYPKVKIHRYDTSADMIMSLTSGKIDAAMLGHITAALILKKNPELGLLTNDGLDMPLGVGFDKNNPKLLNEFNTFLREIRQNGTYDKMYHRWFEEDAELAVMPEFTTSGSKEKIVVGVAIDDLPYVAMVNNKLVGFDIEMISSFAQQYGYEPEFITMEFSALVAALASGKVDMISDGIAISAERAKQINFSDEYATFRTAVIALKKNLTAHQDEVTEVAKPPFWERLSGSFYSNLILEQRYLMILKGLYITILISILAALFGTLLGGVVCAMRMSKKRAAKAIAIFYISLVRGTPVLVLLMIIYYVIFSSVNINPVLVAVIAFGINFAAYVSEMFRTSIESIDRGQKEAGIASGFTKAQTFIHIIMPQAIRRVLPVYKGEVISLVKMTSVVGYIAVEDLTKASDIIRSRTFDAFFPLLMAAVIYILLSWLLTLGLNRIEINLDPRKRMQRNRLRKKIAEPSEKGSNEYH